MFHEYFTFQLSSHLDNLVSNGLKLYFLNDNKIFPNNEPLFVFENEAKFFMNIIFVCVNSVVFVQFKHNLAYFTIFLKTFKVSAFLMIIFVYVSLAMTLDSQNPNLTGQIQVFTGLSSWNITTQEYQNKRIFKPCLYFMYTT